MYENEAPISQGEFPYGRDRLLLWWQEPHQRRRFPALSLMAIDILSVPAMEASAERLFSAANRSVTDDRNRLKPETIEMLQCLKSWNKGPFCSGHKMVRHRLLLPTIYH